MNDKVEPPNRNEVKITHSANKPTEVPITRLHISYDVKDVKYETLVAEQSSFSGECELCGRSLQRTRITIKVVIAPFYTQPSTLVVGNCCTDVRVYTEPSMFFGTDKDLKVGSTFDSIAILKIINKN